MIKIISLFLFIVALANGPARADVNSDSASTEMVKQRCQFAIDDALLAKMRLSADPLENSSEKLAVIQYGAKVPIKSKLRNTTILFECEDIAVVGEVRLSPRDRIANENSGGRYFKHIAWTREYKGSGWTGSLAFVDDIVGDGKKNRVGLFALCRAPTYHACISVEIIADVKFSAKDFATVYEIFDNIKAVR